MSYSVACNCYGVNTTVIGIINGQEVKFDLNGGEVPTDEEVQDILSTILMLNGQEAQQKDGKFTCSKEKHSPLFKNLVLQ